MAGQTRDNVSSTDERENAEATSHCQKENIGAYLPSNGALSNKEKKTEKTWLTPRPSKIPVARRRGSVSFQCTPSANYSMEGQSTQYIEEYPVTPCADKRDDALIKNAGRTPYLGTIDLSVAQEESPSSSVDAVVAMPSEEKTTSNTPTEDGLSPIKEDVTPAVSRDRRSDSVSRFLVASPLQVLSCHSASPGRTAERSVSRNLEFEDAGTSLSPIATPALVRGGDQGDRSLTPPPPPEETATPEGHTPSEPSPVTEAHSVVGLPDTARTATPVRRTQVDLQQSLGPQVSCPKSTLMPLLTYESSKLPEQQVEKYTQPAAAGYCHRIGSPSVACGVVKPSRLGGRSKFRDAPSLIGLPGLPDSMDPLALVDTTFVPPVTEAWRVGGSEGAGDRSKGDVCHEPLYDTRGDVMETNPPDALIHSSDGRVLCGISLQRPKLCGKLDNGSAIPYLMQPRADQDFHDDITGIHLYLG